MSGDAEKIPLVLGDYITIGRLSARIIAPDDEDSRPPGKFVKAVFLHPEGEEGDLREGSVVWLNPLCITQKNK